MNKYPKDFKKTHYMINERTDAEMDAMFERIKNKPGITLAEVFRRHTARNAQAKDQPVLAVK